MRTCPHCGGELRPSVIRCVHCGTPLQTEPQPATAVVGTTRATGRSGSPVGTTVPPLPPRTPSRGPPIPTPAGGGHERPDGDQGHATRRRARVWELGGQTVPVASTSARHVDGWLMGAAVLAVATAVTAISSLSLAWTDGRLSIAGTRRTHAVAELTFRASDSYGGTTAVVIGVTMTLLGLLWFWYGTDRTNHLPAYAHPAIAMIVGLAGWAAIGASTVGSFFWEHAFVERSQEAGLTPEAVRGILDDGARRVVELERLAGFQRFAVAATCAVLAGAVAVPVAASTSLALAPKPALTRLEPERGARSP